MIKRVIGVIFTIAVFVVILIAAINVGEYRSMVFNRGAEPRQSVERVEAERPAVDSSAVKKSKPKKQLTPEKSRHARGLLPRRGLSVLLWRIYSYKLQSAAHA